jgi:hypothetical protein
VSEQDINVTKLMRENFNKKPLQYFANDIEFISFFPSQTLIKNFMSFEAEKFEFIEEWHVLNGGNFVYIKTTIFEKVDQFARF